MEEMLYKFIDEGRREHEEMGAFIREFKTTNELLLNNSLSELKFKVYGLSKAINNVQLSDCEVKGVTTRGGKTITETIRDTNIINTEPPVLQHDKPVGPNKVFDETKPQETKEQTVRLPTPLIPFPHRLKKEKEEAQQRKLEEACTVTMNERCSAVLLNKLPSKEKDPGTFIIPCDIGHLHIDNALADLISLMPYTMYEKLGLGEPKPMRISLELAYRSIKYPRGIAENILIKIDKFILPIDFVILDMREDSRILIILGRPFLATARAMIDVFNKKITLRVGNEERMPFGFCNAPVTFQRCMTTIFHDMVEDFMEVFMDDFSVFDWNVLFEFKCDASDFVVGAVLGQRIDGKFKPIYYASKTLNDAQAHYITTEKELIAVVFSFDKFRPYLILSETVVYTDHSALKYLFSKQDAKPRLFRWVMLMQGFNIKIKDKKGAQNLVADHLSRLKNPNMGELIKEEIADKFPDEHLMILKSKLNDDQP
ncbi:reverse transcriptase domain-containing protein [Tanacetum coccineum]